MKKYSEKLCYINFTRFFAHFSPDFKIVVGQASKGVASFYKSDLTHFSPTF